MAKLSRRAALAAIKGYGVLGFTAVGAIAYALNDDNFPPSNPRSERNQRRIFWLGCAAMVVMLLRLCYAVFKRRSERASNAMVEREHE